MHASHTTLSPWPDSLCPLQGPESAAHEISMWFKEGELVNWTPAEAVWVYEPAKAK